MLEIFDRFCHGDVQPDWYITNVLGEVSETNTDSSTNQEVPHDNIHEINTLEVSHSNTVWLGYI